MEPLAFARRVVAWRWTPCLAPVMGSVLFALLTLAVIPDEIGGAATGAAPLTLRDRGGKTPGEDGTAADDGPPTRRAAAGIGRSRVAPDPTQALPDKSGEPPVEADPGVPPQPFAPPPPAPFVPPGAPMDAPPPPDEPASLTP